MTTLKDKIQPNELQTEKHYWDTFGNYETEVSARLIVKFLADRGKGWASFTRKELDDFFPKERGFHFNRLALGHKPDIDHMDDVFTVQTSFVVKVSKWLHGDQASA